MLEVYNPSGEMMNDYQPENSKERKEFERTEEYKVDLITKKRGKDWHAGFALIEDNKEKIRVIDFELTGLNDKAQIIFSNDGQNLLTLKEDLVSHLEKMPKGVKKLLFEIYQLLLSALEEINEKERRNGVDKIGPIALNSGNVTLNMNEIKAIDEFIDGELEHMNPYPLNVRN